MATDASIAVSVKDNFSAGITGMKKNLTDFEKEITAATQKIQSLNRQKANVAVDVAKAKQELKEARKAFDDTDESARRLAEAEYNYANLTSELKSVTSEANSASRALNSLRDQQAKAENRAGGSSASSGGISAGTSGGGSSGSGSGGILQTLGAAGATGFVGDVVSDVVGAYIGSAFSSETGTVISSALSSASTGAAIGTAIAPGIGTAVGAVGGALLGAVSGATQNFESRDDYFKSLVEDRYDQYNQEIADALSAGSTVASSREQSRLQFSTLLGSDRAAAEWVDWMQQYGAVTPFSFDDLSSMSRVGLSYGFDTDELKAMMQAVGDAGSALGIEGTDLQNIAAYLGRMNSSDKVTLEYLNPLIERGIPAIDYLAEAMTDSADNVEGKQYTAGDVYDAISKGILDGSDAVRAIMGAMAEDYAGSMAAMSETYAGKQSTLQDAEDQLNAAMGEGYNTEREKGIDAQLEYLSGETGQQMEEMYSLIGQYQASLENAKEEAIRDAMTAVVEEDPEYQQALAEGNGAKMGELLAAAKAKAETEYTQTKEYQQYLSSQQGMIESLQTELSGSYEALGYSMGEKLSEGLKSAEKKVRDAAQQVANAALAEMAAAQAGSYSGGMTGVGAPNYITYSPDVEGPANAAGLSYVPYDNYRTRLHEGERVLTAAENRAYTGGSVGVTVTGNNFTVREEADIERIAAALADEIEQRRRLAWQ